MVMMECLNIRPFFQTMCVNDFFFSFFCKFCPFQVCYQDRQGAKEVTMNKKERNKKQDACVCYFDYILLYCYYYYYYYYYFFLLRIALDGAASNLAEFPVRALRQAVVVFIS